MTAVILAIFVATYVGMALGRVPGLAIDRSGMALIAAMLVVVLGAVAPEAVSGAIRFPTLILLFALLLLFTGLFVVNRALADTGLIAGALEWLRACPVSRPARGALAVGRRMARLVSVS